MQIEVIFKFETPYLDTQKYELIKGTNQPSWTVVQSKDGPIAFRVSNIEMIVSQVTSTQSP